MRPHFKIGFLISNFEKAFVVISIAIKIMILIVLNLSILSPLHLPMVKFVNQVATLKSLVNTVFMQNIVVVYAKNIRLNVILNAATMIQARNPRIGPVRKIRADRLYSSWIPNTGVVDSNPNQCSITPNESTPHTDDTTCPTAIEDGCDNLIDNLGSEWNACKADVDATNDIKDACKFEACIWAGDDDETEMISEGYGCNKVTQYIFVAYITVANIIYII